MCTTDTSNVAHKVPGTKLTDDKAGEGGEASRVYGLPLGIDTIYDLPTTDILLSFSYKAKP